MADAAIAVEGVSKQFRLYHDRNQTLKAAVVRGHRARYEEFWALRNVSFDIERGETFGIIGPNGSGKSTLLKCLARILRPEEGTIEVRGSLSALLELGAGFHPELSGRENVYLNAAILGLTRKEVDAKFDEIVDFAGLERFIDLPVKNYSSGMYVRLGLPSPSTSIRTSSSSTRCWPSGTRPSSAGAPRRSPSFETPTRPSCWCPTDCRRSARCATAWPGSRRAGS
jgi:ABC-type polysaccharide/polyol phosphate transport system ATPase subunit